MSSIVLDTIKVGFLCADTIKTQMESGESLTYKQNPLSLWVGGSGAFVLYVMALLALVFFFYKKDKVLDFCGRYLTHAFIIVWMMGFVVYDIGMYPEDCQDATNAFLALLGVAPMAIIYAFEMFFIQSDVSAIHPACYGNVWFMTAFSFAHFLAALISLVFVIRHFGFNIVAGIIRYFKTHVFVGNIEQLYVFWGMNDASYYLAKDIVDGEKLKDSKIIIVRISSEKESTNERIGMTRLFSFLSLTKNNLENLQKLQKSGCLTTSTFGSLTNIQASGGYEILRKELRLHSLVRLMKHTKGVVHFFCLEKDDVVNIQAVANLRRDVAIKAFADRGGKVNFYCHSRYNSIHRVIEDELADENIEVKVVDSSHISVELLKKNPLLHPVRYVNVEKDATVSSPFNALVVGFSEVGMDAVRFLYEFGAFVKSNHDEDTVERSDFHCHVIDQDMKNLAGSFKVNAPSIANERNGGPSIYLHNLDCRSVTFYKKLEQWVETLNYVVVATGDDETNISLAVRIFRLAIRYRPNRLEQLRILVRIQHDENGHIQRIADHYNRLWAANEKSTDKYHLHQKVILSTNKIDTPITLFGSFKQVYTYENVVNEALKDDAKKFKMKYDLSLNELRRLAGEEPLPVQNWDEEQNDLMQVAGTYKGYAPTFSGMMNLRRIQSQNIANSFHKDTKKWMAETALGHDVYEEILRHGLVRREGTLIYSWRDHTNQPIQKVQRVMDVLAQTEHLRWNASHEILGYQMGTDEDGFKDEAKLLHGCLKNWQNLKDITKSYDYNIVDVSLDII